MIACSGISLRILCMYLVTPLPLILTVLLLILQENSLSADFDPTLSTAPPEQSNVTCSKSGCVN